MGKKYYCDYCDKTMVATPSIIRTHIKGISHQRLLNDHYQQYKDPETILQEESAKNPCNRFMNGECQFGSICKFSHYTQEQLNSLRSYLASRNKNTDHQPSFKDLYEQLETDKSSNPNNIEEKNTIVYDENGVTHVLPWRYNDILDSYGDNLPPSIRRLKTSDFTKAYITDWG